MAKFAYPIPNGKVNSEGLTKLISTLYTGSGVVFTDSLTVSASGTPDMNVVVSGSQKNDVAVFIADSGIAYTGWNNNDENVVIDANATGNTMIDTIVAYIDLSAGDAETANAPDGLSFMAIRGAAADTAPTDGAIDTAVGHSLWIQLANVTVANGASSINSGNIEDVRERAQVAKERLEPISEDQNLIKSSYSTSEVNTGAKWTDGKNIYKKTISTGTLTNSSTKTVAHGISGLDTLVQIIGSATDGTNKVNLPYVHTSPIIIWINNTNVNVQTTSDRTSYTGFVTLLYTKT